MRDPEIVLKWRDLGARPAACTRTRREPDVLIVDGHGLARVNSEL